MRAAVLWEAGGVFDVRDDVERRDPGPGEVVVGIRATGMCRTDLSLAGGTFPPPVPIVLGHEGAGEIVEVGPGVAGLGVGDRVVLDWVAPCGRCWACRDGSTQLCAGRSSSSVRTAEPPLRVRDTAVSAGLGTGTWAQQSVVSASAAVPIDDDVPFPVAAVLGCAVATGAGAVLFTARVDAGDHVLVVGCGGVGLAAVQGAVAAGAATVLAVDPVATRRDTARSFGATTAASLAEAADVGTGLDRGGFDHALDVVGTGATIRGGWDAIRPGGQLTVVGAGSRTEEVTFGTYELFHHEKRIAGSFYGSTSLRRDAPRLLGMWRAGRLDLDALVTSTLPLDDITEGVRRVRAGEGVRTVLLP